MGTSGAVGICAAKNINIELEKDKLKRRKAKRKNRVYNVGKMQDLPRYAGKLIWAEEGEALYERTSDGRGLVEHFLVYVPKGAQIERKEIIVDHGRKVALGFGLIGKYIRIIDPSKRTLEHYRRGDELPSGRLVYNLLAEKLMQQGVKTG